MKKTIIIISLVLACVLALGALGTVGYYAYTYSNTLKEYEAMEQEKTIAVDNGEVYANPLERVKDVEMVKDTYSQYTYVYERDNIHFLSNLDTWNVDNLALLADELYANKHGEEIDYVSTVILNEGTDGEYAGTHSRNRETFLIPVELFDFLPNSKFQAKTMLAEINLYGAEEYTTVDEMAVVLSHEYGHHFTYYHFGLTFSDLDKKTEYYKLRSQNSDKIMLDTGERQEYLDNHMWFLVEYAAEDYVYFLGSEKAHRVVEFLDTADQVGIYARGGDSALAKVDSNYEFCRNGSPHENVSSGLPDEVEGLEEYFYSFIDEEPPVHEVREPLGTLNLKMMKPGSRQHKFTWDTPYKDSNVIYTLILYSEDDETQYMVRTRTGDEKGVANFGYYTHKITKGNWIYTYSLGWDLDIGTKMRARVSIVFPDGSVLLSDPLDFEY